MWISARKKIQKIRDSMLALRRTSLKSHYMRINDVCFYMCGDCKMALTSLPCLRLMSCCKSWTVERDSWAGQMLQRGVVLQTQRNWEISIQPAEGRGVYPELPKCHHQRTGPLCLQACLIAEKKSSYTVTGGAFKKDSPFQTCTRVCVCPHFSMLNWVCA